MDFSNEQDGAKAILGEACKVLQAARIDYVVLGGWIPFLFNSNELPHPGSFDVDLLLNPNTTKVEFNKTVEEFKKIGYMLPAKNKFQLYKPLSVDGEQLVFHIDMLHINYAPYQDEDDFYINWGKMQSINGPGTDLIFTHNERRNNKLPITLPDGKLEEVEVNFANEIGFLSAKGRALSSPKRKRDAYDIYLVITQSVDLKYLQERSFELYNSSPIFKKSIDSIHKFFLTGEKRGIKNVKKYLALYQEKVSVPKDSWDGVIEERVSHFVKQVTRQQ